MLERQDRHAIRLKQLGVGQQRNAFLAKLLQNSSSSRSCIDTSADPLARSNIGFSPVSWRRYMVSATSAL